MSWVYVAVGGALGSVLRYALGIAMLRVLPNDFPYGTLGVNLIGCMAIGLMAGIFAEQLGSHHSLWLFLGVGVLGGFTTFSAFGLDNVFMWSKAEFLKSLIYTGASLLGGLGLCGVAFWLGELLTR